MKIWKNLTRQRENFLVLLNNMDTALNLQTKELDSAGSAAKRYEAFIESTTAKMNNFKNAMQQFWMGAVSSNTINAFIDGATNMVKNLQTLQTLPIAVGRSIDILAVAIIALTVAMIHFKPSVVNAELSILMGSIGTYITRLASMTAGQVVATIATSALATAETALTAASTLLISPLGIIVGILALVTLGVVGYTQHLTDLKEQTDKNKASLQDLTKAINENNQAEMKTNSDSLKGQQSNYRDLLKQKIDAEKQLGKANTNGNTIDISKAEVQLQRINSLLSDQQKELADAGVSYNELTGEIYKVTEAEARLSDNKIVTAINQTTDSEIKQKDSIISLYSEYNNLIAKHQDASVQANALANKVQGLTLAQDSQGNTIIVNTGLMDTEVQMLGAEGIAVGDLTNAKLLSAKNAMTYQVNETQTTYFQIMERIKYYSQEASALAQLQASRANMANANSTDSQGFTDAEIKAGIAYRDGKPVTVMTRGEASGRLGGNQVQLDKYETGKNAIDAIFKAISAPSGGTPDPGNYTPAGGTGGGGSAKETNGWIPNPSTGKWYFYKDGKKCTGWIQDDSKWYYLNSDGEMQTGWLKDGDKWYYLGTDGAMYSDQWMGNYHLNKTGVMDTSTITSDNFIVDDSGKWNGKPSMSKTKDTLDTFVKKTETQLAGLDYEDKLLPDSDTLGKADIVAKKLKLMNDEITNTQSTLDDLSGITLKDADAQKTLDDRISDLTNSLISNKSKVIDLTTEYKKLYTDDITSYIDKQISSLDDQADAEDEINQRLQNRNDLIKLQTELQNIQKNKNIQTLTQGKDGTWQYKYTYDTDAYNQKADEIKDKVKSNAEWETSIKRQHEKQDLENLKNSLTDTNNITQDKLDEMYGKYDDTWNNIITNVQNKIEEMNKVIDSGGTYEPDLSSTKSEKSTTTKISSSNGYTNGIYNFDRSFDSGGLAYGKGLLPKDTVLPEEVLSPEMTPLFRRLVDFVPNLVAMIPNIERMTSSIPNIGSNSKGINTFNFGNISLPNVTDSKSFVSGIKQLTMQKLEEI